MRFSRYKSLKWLALAVSILSAIYIFIQPSVQSFFSNLSDITYIVAFANGLLFPVAYLLPFSVGILMAIRPENIWIVLALSSIGALATNFFMYYYFKDLFMTEYDRQKRLVVLRRVYNLFEKERWTKLKMYAICIFAGVFILLPISEETETLFITGMREIDFSTLLSLSLVINALIMLALLLI